MLTSSSLHLFGPNCEGAEATVFEMPQASYSLSPLRVRLYLLHLSEPILRKNSTLGGYFHVNLRSRGSFFPKSYLQSWSGRDATRPSLRRGKSSGQHLWWASLQGGVRCRQENTWCSSLQRDFCERGSLLVITLGLPWQMGQMVPHVQARSL